MKTRPQKPTLETVSRTSACTEWANMPIWGKCVNSPYRITKTCVTRNVRKTGTRGITDSFTPRIFRIIIRMTITTASSSLYWCHSSGRKLKIASAPLAMETAMVST